MPLLFLTGETNLFNNNSYNSVNIGNQFAYAQQDEIENGSSTTVNFNSSDIDTGNYDSFDYYCEYHPETMLGKLQIN